MTEATYAGTTGWSGTDTSREQAQPHKHTMVQSKVLSAVTRHGDWGLTIADLRRIYPDSHHGSLSSALTNLHRAGRLARLTDKRERCHIYVLPEYVGDRATEGPRPLGSTDDARADYGGHLHAQGYREGRTDAANAIGQHINAMLAAMPDSAVAHNERCWQKHPRCALMAVRKVTIRMGEEGPL